jgi:hypothetical protein
MRTDGQTDIHDEANSYFLQFFEPAWKKKKLLVFLDSFVDKSNAIFNAPAHLITAEAAEVRTAQNDLWIQRPRRTSWRKESCCLTQEWIPSYPSQNLQLYHLYSLTLSQANGFIYFQAYSNNNIDVTNFINHLQRLWEDKGPLISNLIVRCSL